MLRSLDEAGGPVLEEVAGTDDVLVTFACLRDDPAVTLRTPLVSLVADSNPDGDIILQRLPNTRLWYTSMLVDRRVSTSYQFRVPGASPGLEAEVEQSLLLNPSGLQAFARAMLPRGFADASNPEKLFPHYGVLAGTSSGGTPAALWESVLTLPGAEPFPYLDGAAERGRVVERDFSTTATPGVRTVGVYLPVGYDSRKEYPLVVAVDGEFYRRVARLPEILDAAIVSGVIPPVIVAFWHNQDASSRQRELACSADFLSAIADEFYPWIEATFSVSTAPRERVITGFSLGGLASAWVALERPDVFGSVLAVSPSLWFTPGAGAEPGWLIREYATAGRRPGVYLSIGVLETGSLERVGSPHSMLDFAREFRDVLTALPGAQFNYREEHGGHDYVHVRRATVNGLAALLGD